MKCSFFLSQNCFAPQKYSFLCKTRQKAQELEEIRRIYQNAELKAHQNSAAGYREAIDLLQTIPWVEEAQGKSALYQSRMKEREQAEARRAAVKDQTAKRTTA